MPSFARKFGPAMKSYASTVLIYGFTGSFMKLLIWSVLTVGGAPKPLCFVLSHVPPCNDSTGPEWCGTTPVYHEAAMLRPWGKSKKFRLSFPHVMAQ